MRHLMASPKLSEEAWQAVLRGRWRAGGGDYDYESAVQEEGVVTPDVNYQRR